MIQTVLKFPIIKKAYIKKKQKQARSEIDEPGMTIPDKFFDHEPASVSVSVTLAIKPSSDVIIDPIKVKKKKKQIEPTPTPVSNHFLCLTNDDDDNYFADQTADTSPPPKTLPYSTTLDGTNDMLTNKGENERDDDVATAIVLVETREITNIAIKPTSTKCEEVLDLGNLLATAEGMPLLHDDDDNDGDDDVSTVRVETKNSREEKYNMSAKIPPIF